MLYPVLKKEFNIPDFCKSKVIVHILNFMVFIICVRMTFCNATVITQGHTAVSKYCVFRPFVGPDSCEVIFLNVEL
jgi:hypothetical protein